LKLKLNKCWPFNRILKIRAGKLSDNEKAECHPCVAHRGWSSQAPENTMAAFRMALSEPYVTWIELDVHLSKDEVPVVIHDSTLKRTTNRQGKVRDLTADQLAALDAGGWFSPKFSGEGVPSLGSVLDLVRGRCLLDVELKGEGDERGLLAKRAVEAIQARGMQREVVVTSFNPALLRQTRTFDPSIPVGLIIDENPPGLVGMLRELNATYLSIGYSHLKESLLKETAEAGIEVIVWTVNEKEALNHLISRHEPFLICTNYPDRWYATVSS
jgi:glycerophosphoryl diester phosphodiesterase